MQILPNIFRSKDNKTIKFGKLLEHNTRIGFLEKPYTNCGGQTILKPLSKKTKLSLSLDH